MNPATQLNLLFLMDFLWVPPVFLKIGSSSREKLALFFSSFKVDDFHFFLSFPFLFSLLFSFLSCLFVLSKTFCIMLNRSGERKDPSLFLSLVEKTFSISAFRKISAVGFS